MLSLSADLARNRTGLADSNLDIETRQMELLLPLSNVVRRNIYMGGRIRPRNQRLDVKMRHPMRKNLKSHNTLEIATMPWGIACMIIAFQM